jgi:3-hydroxyisobutyrate dehydrogenase
MERSRIGFIGLGDIGLPMARRLFQQGLTVVSSANRRREPFDEHKPLDLIECNSVREVAEQVEVLLTIVIDEKQTDAVLHGNHGAFADLAADSIVLVMSTLSPGYCQGLAEEAGKIGIHVLDCPITGGVIAAANGTLGLLAGGEISALDRCRGALAPLGTIYHCGAVGKGQIAKLANNAVAFANCAALDEARSMAKAHGMDLPKLMQIISHGTGQSFMTDKWDFIVDNWSHLRPLGQKDVNLFIDAARTKGLTSKVIETMNSSSWTIQSDNRAT